MKDPDIQNATVDELERKLFEALKLKDLQIEEIVASPYLFRSVMKRIEGRHESLITVERASAWQWDWRLSLAAYSLLAVVISGAVLFSIYERKPQPPSPESVSILEQPDRIVSSFNGSTEVTREIDLRVKKEPAPQHTVFKIRTKLREHHGPPIEEVSEFYPVTGSVDGNDVGSQLIRVDLPRSALAAMGVEVPFENNGPKVKTDLLIGSDGVMHAVRFVK